MVAWGYHPGLAIYLMSRKSMFLKDSRELCMGSDNESESTKRGLWACYPVVNLLGSL